MWCDHIDRLCTYNKVITTFFCCWSEIYFSQDVYEFGHWFCMISTRAYFFWQACSVSLYQYIYIYNNIYNYTNVFPRQVYSMDGLFFNWWLWLAYLVSQLVSKSASQLRNQSSKLDDCARSYRRCKGTWLLICAMSLLVALHCHDCGIAVFGAEKPGACTTFSIQHEVRK